MSTLPKPRLTPEEYLAIEDAAEYKSEYFQGEMFAMAGATYEHNLIAGRVARHIGNQVDGRPCTVCQSDKRVHTPRTGFYTYPDVVVVCGEPAFLDPKKRMNLLNPTIIVEVFSPGTEAYDRGRKFEHYQTIDSLREYLMVASDRVAVTLYRQADNQWLLITANTPESSIELESVGCRLLLRDLYDRVSFPGEATV